ncbi:MAG: hypothetical protein H8D23_08175 [Candidatus Brocadiales bacterium]|nr:hypothetical protein [Candidatus Brocadiales bacterium]
MLRLPPEHWGFRTSPSGLQLGSHSISELANKFGTPFYLFDEDRLRTNAGNALNTARRILPKVEILYSFKTNSHPCVLKVIREEGFGAEAISSREIHNAVNSGFSSEKMVFNGPGKSDKDLALAVKLGVLVQVESASEASALARIAIDTPYPVRAGIRINPNVFEPRAQATLQMGSQGNVFGLNPEGEEFKETVRIFTRTKGIQLVSLSAHIGTGITSTEPFRQLAIALMNVRNKLSSHEIEISTLDFGGGFAVCSEVRYSDSEFDTLQTEGEVEVPSPAEIASFDQVCEAIAQEVMTDPTLSCMMEPGRLLVSDTFHLITRVIRIKKESGVRYAIVDAGRVQNALFAGRGYHEIIHINTQNNPAQTPYTIVGPLCANFDIFARSRLMPELAEGDLIAVMDVGAYNLSAQSNWSFDPARIIAINGEGVVEY